jgi:hypothetical protein
VNSGKTTVLAQLTINCAGRLAVGIYDLWWKCSLVLESASAVVTAIITEGKKVAVHHNCSVYCIYSKFCCNV